MRTALESLLAFLVATILMVVLVTMTFLGATGISTGLFLWILLESGV